VATVSLSLAKTIIEMIAIS